MDLEPRSADYAAGAFALSTPRANTVASLLFSLSPTATSQRALRVRAIIATHNIPANATAHIHQIIGASPSTDLL